MILGLSTTFVLALTSGCCNDKLEEIHESIDSWDELGRKCCQGMVDPDGRAECLRRHREKMDELKDLADRWYDACREDDKARKRILLRLLGEVLLTVAVCQTDGPVVGAANGRFASLVSPLASVDAVDLALEGTVQGGRSTLAGPICLTTNEATVCADVVASIRWIETTDGRGSAGRAGMTPLEFRLKFPELEGVSLEMVPFEGNGVFTDDDGRSVLGARMRIQDEIGVFGLAQEAWFEFPFDRRGTELAIMATGLAGSELAPEVPGVIADWNEDRRVDDLDHVDFLADLAAGLVDLDDDGYSGDGDLEYFESRWRDEFTG